MKLYRYGAFCLCDGGGWIPPDAVPTEQPFAPLVFVVHRQPQTSRGLFCIHSLAELEEPETVFLLARHQRAEELSALGQLTAHCGAAVLNTAFSNAYSFLKAVSQPKTGGFRVNLIGLGDVGGTVLLGLKLLGREIAEIGIYDPNEALCRRYALELNQVLPEHDGEALPPVTICEPQAIFNCDALLFTASLGVPPVGAQVQDVRMAQYTKNREMLRAYARQARQAGFGGLFAQISDPVDHLSRAVFLETNRTQDGQWDGNGLLPEQIQGYGLGVMRARAVFYAQKRGVDFSNGAVFGPHGRDLIVANDAGSGYDAAVSAALTQDTVTANLRVRELGFKPYLAPGLSSAAVSVLRTLRGEWHDGAAALGGAYFGCRSRMTRQGLELEKRELSPELLRQMERVHTALREFDYDG